MKHLYLLLFCFCISIQALNAQALFGGELQVAHVNDNYYNIILHIYFDASQKPADSLPRQIRSTTHPNIPGVASAPVASQILHFSNKKLLKYPQNSFSACENANIQLVKATYQTTVHLDPALYTYPNGYYIIAAYFNRNKVNNIKASISLGNIFHIEIPPVIKNNVSLRNSSPKFNPVDTVFTLVDSTTVVDLGASDADGDELRYSLVTPFGPTAWDPYQSLPPSNYPLVNWADGFDTQNPIAPGMTIDPQTGKITFTPNKKGQFLFTVLCEEIRDGEIIGRVRRDFELIVKDCVTPVPPSLNNWQIIGSEFQVENLDGFDHEILLHIYLDISQTPRPAISRTMNVNILGKKNNAPTGFAKLYISKQQVLKFPNPNCSNPARNTLKLTYQTSIKLKPSIYNDPDGYYLVTQLCCRNNVDNLIGSQITETITYTEFPAVTTNKGFVVNSTPKFKPQTNNYACVNHPFSFDFGATDADGDQLRYSLVDAFGPEKLSPYIGRSPLTYPLVKWKNGYNAQNAIAPGMTIDPGTGIINVTPNKAGKFLFTVLCEEIRNGQVIGKVRKDFDLLVTECTPNQAPRMLIRQEGQSSFYTPKDTVYANFGQNSCFKVFAFDPDVHQSLQLKVKPINFVLTDSTKFELSQISASDSLTFKLCIPECLALDTNQPLIFELVAEDNGCATPKQALIQMLVIAQRPPNTPIQISSTLLNNTKEVKVNESISFDIKGHDLDSDSIKVKALGRGFDLATLGIVFDSIQGKGNVGGSFQWIPDCSAIQDTINEYLIDFIFTEKLACKNVQDTLTIRLIIRDKQVDLSKFFPSNVFTPNNDGKNDTFRMPNLPEENCRYQFKKIDIYNRWGSRVFHSKDRNFSWEAKSATPGVYYYSIDFKSVKYKGQLSLIK